MNTSFGSSSESSVRTHSRQNHQINSPESSSSSSSRPPVPRSRPHTYNHISSDKKNILINCYNDGKTINESAEIAGVNKNTAKSIIKQYNKNCGLQEKKRGGNRPPKLTPAILSKIEQIIEENPSITLTKIGQKIRESEHTQLSISSIRNGLKRLRITLKCASIEVDHRNSARTIEERKVYAIQFSHNAPEERQKIIFIDESGFNYHLRRTKARSRVNTPARVTVPTTRGRNISLIAAINIRGIVCHEIIQQSTVNSSIFCDFLRKLFQKLRDDNLDEVWLVLDNASIHKTQEVRDLVCQTRQLLVFPPPYSPMLNPTEEVFSKIKFSARDMLADPLNRQNLVDVINNSVGTVTSTNCYNYYMNMYVKLPAAAAREPL